MNYRILFIIILFLITSCEYIHDPFRNESNPTTSSATTSSTTTTTPIYDFNDI